MSRSQINQDKASLIFLKSQSIVKSKYDRKHEHEHEHKHEHVQVLSSAITTLIADGTRVSHRSNAKTLQMDDIPPPSFPIPIRLMRSSSASEDEVRSNAGSNTNAPTNTNTNTPSTPAAPVPHTNTELLPFQHRIPYSRSSSFYDGARTVTAAVQFPNNTNREQWNILIRMLRKNLLLIHLQYAYLKNLRLKRSQELSSATSSYSSFSTSFFLRTETSVSTNDISRYSSNKDEKDEEGRDDVEGRIGYNDWHLSPVISCLGSPTKEHSFCSPG